MTHPTDIKHRLEIALESYRTRTGRTLDRVSAVLFDMDGVLYDSMPLHARAWKAMCDRVGIQATENEFFAYEGRTGKSTINLLYQRQYGHGADDDTCRELYGYKSENFKSYPQPPMMPGALEAVQTVQQAGRPTILVTGSGQRSLIDRLHADYPGAFRFCITASDVQHGKPHPEPYLRGMSLVGAKPWESVAVDNAPLGVESASRAGAFTIGVRTGPIPEGSLKAAGADIEINSMAECAKVLSYLL